MPKRPASTDASKLPNLKKARLEGAAQGTKFTPNKIATAENAAAVDADLPLDRLLESLKHVQAKKVGKSEAVVHYMRMGDLRIKDNRALSQASEQARKEGAHLVVLFIISPQDYVAHDRGARRIDFVLRNLRQLQTKLAELNIPLHVITHNKRRTIPNKVVEFLVEVNAKRLYASIEYEVDELRRDLSILSLAKDAGVHVTLVHDRCIVEPGVVLTGQGKSYGVYSPYQRNWLGKLNDNIPYYLEDCPIPQDNPDGVRESASIGPLFTTPIPEFVEGFQLDEQDQAKMKEVWPEGEDVAKEILDRFLNTKARGTQLGAVDPLAEGEEEAPKHTRIQDYNNGRDRGDRDSTSRLSPYLSAGVISARECVRATMLKAKSNKVDGSKATGPGTWIQELAWRDFYTCLLAAHPRVSMGRPYNEKMSQVSWEPAFDAELRDPSYGDDAQTGHGVDAEDNLEKWRQGKTGYPIVDAAMRCTREMGWLHNRMRMIAAMFLSKHLLIDWRLGERHFMRMFMDGDLASNNGGWQWVASTGADACPYFRIFNPYSQSLKADPTGDFIRHWVPELRKLKGPDLHNPSKETADKLGYPRAIVKHEEARERALRRYKNPGEE